MSLGGGGGGGGRVRLSDVDTGRLSRLKYKLVCSLKLGTDIFGGDIREFVNDADRPIFLERELMELSVGGYR